MDKRRQLQAALTAAEEALAKAVAEANGSFADRADVEAIVENARAACRRARAAIAKLERTEPATKASRPQERPRTTMAAPPQELPRLTRAGGTALNSCGRSAIAMSPLLRHAIGLLALVLSYLQYYFLDVHLQIIALPSVAKWMS